MDFRLIKRFALFSFSAVFLLACAEPAITTEAKTLAECGVDSAEHERLMALDQPAFDQDFQGGWRAVDYIEGCSSAAGDLILAYIDQNDLADAPDSKLLWWHVGQAKAGAGETEAAIAAFERAYETDEDDHNAAWNLYADATIAFLLGDRDGVQAAYDTLSAIEVTEAQRASRQAFLDNNPNITMPAGFLTEPSNLTPVRRLLVCFGQPYDQAYHHCDADAEVGE